MEEAEPLHCIGVFLRPLLKRTAKNRHSESNENLFEDTNTNWIDKHCM